MLNFLFSVDVVEHIQLFARFLVDKILIRKKIEERSGLRITLRRRLAQTSLSLVPCPQSVKLRISVEISYTGQSFCSSSIAIE